LSNKQIEDKLTGWSNRDRSFYKDQKISGTLYYADSESKHVEFMQDVSKNYLFQNPLHFDLFPSVAQIEAEVISMVADLYNGNEATCGLCTSGGTESIMLAMLAYRE